MKIHLPEFSHADVYEYAASRGAMAAAKGHPPSTTLFNWIGKTAQELRFIYEFSYLMEKESRALRDSCEFETDNALVSEWNEGTGWGKLTVGIWTNPIEFDYRIIEGDNWVSQGDRVSVRFKYSNEGIEILKVSHENK